MKSSSSSSSCRAISTDIPDPLSHPSLQSIASGRSSRIHLVSTQSCCMQVRAGRPVFARPCEGVHESTSLMSSSLFLQQCPECLVRLILTVFVQLLLCGVLPPGLVQYRSQHSCVVTVKLFLNPFSQRPCSASIQQCRHDRCVSFYRSGLTSL